MDILTQLVANAFEVDNPFKKYGRLRYSYACKAFILIAMLEGEDVGEIARHTNRTRQNVWNTYWEALKMSQPRNRGFGKQVIKLRKQWKSLRKSKKS